MIVNGLKDIENRTWRTSHRGVLLIHASKTVDREDIAWLREAAAKAGIETPAEFVTGAIIGGVTLCDCVTEHESQWFDGPIGWVLDDPFEFVEPEPATGRLGLWEYDDIELDEFPEPA